ncbi:OmpW family protein [Paraburkholderia sp. Cpub6]|uniref:OmpW/AlkL family protein n=1 Tax=Paraburkholderia sp. Cpub6 TaxID=2723094 RepID=UPI00160BA7DF|nr:OmpW family outer membrane protein [Paraburkholderia sp. Cpub6]MBB5462424.1 outer membrane protein [Paraburkholderia sp. Cpub6]
MKQTGVAILLSLSAISAANAQSAGQWTINAGWMHLSPQDSSQPMTVNALGRSATVPGSGTSVSDADTFSLTATYFVTDHVAIETILGVPPKLSLSGTGSLSGLGEMGSARVWSPAILAQYHFGAPNARLRPYLGAGLSYVWFKNIELNSPVATGQFLYSPTLGTHLEGPTSASLSKSLAPVINAGLTYNIDSHWSVGVSASYVWLSTKATLTTRSSLGTVSSSTKVKINPIVTFVSVGYRF